MSRRLVLAPDAEIELERIDDWWRTHRTASPDLFLEEFQRATELLRSFPNSGRIVPNASIEGLRRVVLRQSRQVIYYRHSGDEIEVLILWGAQFGEEPNT